MKSSFNIAPLKQEGKRIKYDGMANRSSLHVDKLGDFTLWLMANGWQYQLPKGDYEVLRMWHHDHAMPLLVHKRATLSTKGISYQHLTLQGMSESMFKKWRNSINGERQERRADSAAAVVEASKSL